jgi:hypothetical protein
MPVAVELNGLLPGRGPGRGPPGRGAAGRAAPGPEVPGRGPLGRGCCGRAACPLPWAGGACDSAAAAGCSGWRGADWPSGRGAAPGRGAPGRAWLVPGLVPGLRKSAGVTGDRGAAGAAGVPVAPGVVVIGDAGTGGRLRAGVASGAAATGALLGASATGVLLSAVLTGAGVVLTGAAGCGRAGAPAPGPGRGAAGRGPSVAGFGLDVSVALVANASLSRRTTGASIVEDADRTNSPISWSLTITVLLSTPNSFASS